MLTTLSCHIPILTLQIFWSCKCRVNAFKSTKDESKWSILALGILETPPIGKALYFLPTYFGNSFKKSFFLLSFIIPVRRLRFRMRFLEFHCKHDENEMYSFLNCGAMFTVETFRIIWRNVIIGWNISRVILFASI